MKIEITREEVLEAAKPVTKATTEEWGNAIKGIVYTVANAMAFMYALGLHLRDYLRYPRRLYEELARIVEGTPEPQLVPVPVPVVSRGEERSLNNEAQAVAVTKSVKRTRSRKRSAKNAHNTSPARGMMSA